MKTTFLAALAALSLTAPAYADHQHDHGDTAHTHADHDHSGDDHSDHAEAAPAAPGGHANMTTDITAGDLTVSGAYSRATLPNAPVAAGFMTLVNAGETDDRLLSVSSDASTRVEIHEMAMEDGVMKMRQLADGLVVPAGETVTLEPGGYHLMFMDLTQTFDEGDSVETTLMFEQAGVVTVTLPIGAPNAKGADHAGHKD